MTPKIAIVSSLGIAVLAVAAWQKALVNRFDDAWDDTREGDSYEEVVRKFGSPPATIRPCPKPDMSTEIGRLTADGFPKCARYISYEYLLSKAELGTWIVQFDDRDRVSGKEYSLLP